MDFLGLKTVEDPKRERGSRSFATFMIIGPTCFFLGILFSSFPYDYPLLWTNEDTPLAFYDQLETHLRFMHASPPLISRILNIVIFIGFSGFIIKLFKPSEANLLFDGSSLVLYTIGVIVYLTNIVKGLRIVTAGLYEKAYTAEELAVPGMAVTREDSLRVLAASNTILALVLVGVLVLQVGQWYAELKDRDEAAKFEKAKQDKVAATASQKGGGGSHTMRSSSSKKKQ